MFSQEQLAAIAAAMSVLQNQLQSNSPTTTQHHQLAEPNLAGGLNQYHSQFQRQDFNLTPSPPSPPKHQLDQQQALVNHYRSQLQQHQDLHLNSPPKLLQQQQQQQQQHHHHQQQQQALVDHYQSQLQKADLHISPSPPKHQLDQALVNHYRSQLQQQDLHLNSPPELLQQQQQHLQLHHQQQQQQQQQQQHLQQQALVNHYHSQLNQSDSHIAPAPLKQQQQQVLTNKPTKPESYSAIVAKSAGLTNNNVTGSNCSSTNGTNANINNASNNTYGGLNNSTFSATTTNSIANSDTTTRNLNNNQSFKGLGVTNGIVRNSLTNHVATSTNNIFNTNNLTGNGLGHSNGSLLNYQSNLLALDPNINYTTDHSTSPAQQLFHHSQNLNQQHQQMQPQNHHHLNPSLSNNTPSTGSATNLLGFMGLYVGNLSPDLTKEQLEKIFSKYGEPVKAHRLIRSPVAFIKYENTESPRAAIDDLYGLLLPELTLNQDQPLKLHFDRNDTQLKANYRPTELPPKADNGECYGWRTTVCRRGKNCPKKHIPINRGIDFQMWMIKSTPTTTS